MKRMILKEFTELPRGRRDSGFTTFELAEALATGREVEGDFWVNKSRGMVRFRGRIWWIRKLRWPGVYRILGETPTSERFEGIAFPSEPKVGDPVPERVTLITGAETRPDCSFSMLKLAHAVFSGETVEGGYWCRKAKTVRPFKGTIGRWDVSHAEHGVFAVSGQLLDGSDFLGDIFVNG